MTAEALHPDHLQPGHMVGIWRIVESLGSGNFGHAFKVERDGAFFTLKMAVRPFPEATPDSPEQALEARQVDGRMAHEAAILMANSSHPGLLPLRTVDRWPHVHKGYRYIVTDFVVGEAFHTWRERTRPTAAQLLDIGVEVVRLVDLLHKRGIVIRDFKSEHVFIRAEDTRPVLLDLGSAWLPGGSTLTVGLAPATPHALPPECVTFLREGTWKEGARFEADKAGDLYQVGVFLYEALTDGHPFDPRMPMKELLAAIETVQPRAPHRINPAVPESLSLIVLRLLEKQPEARYESTEALLRALWDAAKERSSKVWRVPLALPKEGPAPVTQEELEEMRLYRQEAERRAEETRKRKEEELSLQQAREHLALLTQAIEDEAQASEQRAVQRRSRWRRAAVGLGGLLLTLLCSIVVWVWLSPGDSDSTEKGSSPVSTLRNSRLLGMGAAWLCATFSVGCSSVQVRPQSVTCTREAIDSMHKMNLFYPGQYRVFVDIHQPGEAYELGVYKEGPIVSRVVYRPGMGLLPDGTLLYGWLWTEGIIKGADPAVLGRYTEALLPDGRRVPICFALREQIGLTRQREGSKPGAVILERKMPVVAVDTFP